MDNELIARRCPNCGRPSPWNRKFCCKACLLKYTEKQRQAAQEKAAKDAELRKVLVNPNQCHHCIYGYNYGGKIYGCGYMFIKDQTRTSLHPEGLTSDCKEFVPRNSRWKRKIPQPSVR